MKKLVMMEMVLASQLTLQCEKHVQDTCSNWRRHILFKNAQLNTRRRCTFQRIYVLQTAFLRNNEISSM